MCNLYRMDNSAAEVARMFGTEAPTGTNIATEVFPGYPALVWDGAALRSMAWGFPLLRKGAKGQALKPRPVNNTRSDRLKSGFWRPSFETRRCLIPLTAFAEAQGPKGGKTRTWFSLPDQPVFTAGGLWRDSAEWGPVFSMIMTEACIHVADIHDRMPVLIAPEDRARWQEGTPHEAYDLCVPFAGPMTVDATSQPWVAAR